MFGFDKFKEIAKKGVKKVVNTDFQLNTPRQEEDNDEELENEQLKAIVTSLLEEKESMTTELSKSKKQLRKIEDTNEDLKVKSLALASQKQILQMKMKFNNNDADQQNEGEDVQDLDTLVAELKESVTRFQTENERLKKELEASQIGIEAERKLHRQELPKVDEAYVPEDAERNMKEMEYLIHTYGIHIENERDYFRQVLNPK